MRPRMVFLAVFALVAACARPGVSGAPPVEPSWSPSEAPSSVAAQSTPTAVATSAPSTAPTERPIRPLGLAGLEPTRLDPTVELLVDIHGDVGGVGRTPVLVAYADGTVLIRGDGDLGFIPLIAKLTPDGLRELKATARDSGLFGASGSIGPDPDYHAGFGTFLVELRVGNERIVRATTNSLTDADRAEGEAIIAIATKLSRFERWLPAAAWNIAPDQAAPYVSRDFLLKITVTKQPWPGGPDDPDGPALDLANIEWPLDGELLRFGDVVEDVGIADVHRCGVVSLTEAAGVEAALARARWEGAGLPGGEWLTTRLTADANGWVIGVTLLNLLPHDQRDCAVDGTWF